MMAKNVVTFDEKEMLLILIEELTGQQRPSGDVTGVVLSSPDPDFERKLRSAVNRIFRYVLKTMAEQLPGGTYGVHAPPGKEKH